ncbi:MAG: hypothetical protein PHS14_20950 [Elusimicrobia bacterium]|nr:hypothetical protein [Elusimicrobiota bacterium]
MVKAAKDAQEALAGLAAASQDARAAVDAAQAVLDAIQIPPPAESAPFPGASELEETELALGWTNRDDTEARLRDGESAAVRIEEARKRQDEARQRQARLQEERTALGEPGVDERPQLEAKDREIAGSRDRLTAAREAAAAARATIKAKTEAIADAEKRRAERDLAKSERETKASELAEWRILERAIDGVRDLELDALAPSIADIATRLLRSSGREGYIEIDTTRISSGSAKKAKQIEDFLIFYVGPDGERQEIATCSGGEMVWIRKVLYDSFAIIRARNGNIKFMTAFLDETDGALYPKDRQDYFRMLLEAHKESGRYQTFLTTHSPDIIAMAAVTLDVTALGPREKKDEGGIAA